MGEYNIFMAAVFTGVLSSLIASYWAFSRKKWEIRRHDYANLLIELEFSGEDASRLNKFREKLELVSIIGSKKLTKKVREIRQIIKDHNYDEIKESGKFTEWHQELYEIMYKEINRRKLFRLIK